MSEVANDPDRLPGLPSFPVQQQPEKYENIPEGMPPLEEDAPTVNGVTPTSASPDVHPNDPFAEQVNNVINSEASFGCLRISCYHVDRVIDWSTDSSFQA